MKVIDRRRYRWKNDGALRRREYESYADYVEHQKQKLDSRPSEWLLEHERHYPRVLAQRIADVAALNRGMTVLCLGAPDFPAKVVKQLTVVLSHRGPNRLFVRLITRDAEAE